MPARGQTTTLHEFAAHSATVNCVALGPKTKTKQVRARFKQPVCAIRGAVPRRL